MSRFDDLVRPTFNPWAPNSPQSPDPESDHPSRGLREPVELGEPAELGKPGDREKIKFKDNDIKRINALKDKVNVILARVELSHNHKRDPSVNHDEILFVDTKNHPEEYRKNLVFSFYDEDGVIVESLIRYCDTSMFLEGLQGTALYNTFFELCGCLDHLYAEKKVFNMYQTIRVSLDYFWVVDRLLYFAATQNWTPPTWSRIYDNDREYWNKFFIKWNLGDSLEYKAWIEGQNQGENGSPDSGDKEQVDDDDDGERVQITKKHLLDSVTSVFKSKEVQLVVVTVGLPIGIICALFYGFKLAGHLYDSM